MHAVAVSPRAPDHRLNRGLLGALRAERVRRVAAQRSATEAHRQHRLLLVQSRRMEAELRAMAQQIVAAQEDERRKISRELHDGVVQLLAGVNVHLATLTMHVDDKARDLTRRIVRTQRLVARSIDAVRKFARDLRPALLDDLGLIPALRSFIRDLRTRRRLRIRLTAFPGVDDIAPDLRVVFFRVAQEALTNVVRHARATEAHVRLRQRAGAVTLEIANNGVSFDTSRALLRNRRRRLGLLGMRERVEMAGGRFTLLSSPSEGTVVRAVIPVGSHDERSPS
jgi:two-component system, NarL family, sensor histidine kinase DegS